MKAITLIVHHYTSTVEEVAALSEVRQKLKLRPSPSGGKSHPVTQVSWHDVMNRVSLRHDLMSHKPND